MKNFNLEIPKSSAILSLLFVLLISCKDQKNQENHERQIEIQTQELFFEHGDLFISNNSTFWKEIGKDSLILFEGRDIKSFILFSLDSKKTTEFLTFDSDGPNFIEDRVLDFTRYLDRYLILGAKYLHIADSEGKIVKRIQSDKFENNLANPSAYRISGLQVYNKDTLLISKKLISADLPKILDEPKQSIFALLNLSTDSISDLPVYSPKETLVDDPNQGYYSNLSDHYFIVNNNEIVFNFKFSPTIYKYNLHTELIQEYGGKTKRFPSKREAFPADRYTDYAYLLSHLNQGIYFSQLGYDPSNALYFRLAKQVINDDMGKSQLSNFLQIFDSNFNLIKEVAINEPVAPIFSKFTNEIYLVPLLKYQTEEDKTRILKLVITSH
ncbi:DUF4221 family protein [Roseivirga sp. UBA1976]|uniref:DUF4221 family protein n=1 Tax=Roseivirga sp. UBA1976 TaxID=1947386 RepID=UPI002580F046|nr:DUF4221 family protein [Roseivirga sp. UBA1976]MEC7754579.1 DUF4221 family protein [Bacteroidota bacterium]|tara:strand:+ start:2039 stop:3187 length:1149 start_codon:yes stop_codon:yes gene_type:complete